MTRHSPPTMLKSTVASDAYHIALEKLSAAERGEGITPRVPSAIPIADYYFESEREQNELIAQQQARRAQWQRVSELSALQPSAPDQLEQASLSRCGSIATSINLGSGGDGASDGNSGVSKSFAAQRRGCDGRQSSMFSLFLSGGRNAAGSKKLSLDGGSGGGGSVALIRRQSCVGGFGLLGDMGSSQPQPLMSTTTGARVAKGEAVGGVLVTSMASSIRATTQKSVPEFGEKLLKPIVNPYRKIEANAPLLTEGGLPASMRPHTLALLRPLSLDEASQQIDLDARRREAELATIAVSLPPAHVADAPTKLRSSTAARLDHWRKTEALQLEVHRRRQVEAIVLAREACDALNHRDKNVLDKVQRVQQLAATATELKLAERQRLRDLELQSRHRVNQECMQNMEATCRLRIEASAQLHHAMVSAELDARQVN